MRNNKRVRILVLFDLVSFRNTNLLFNAAQSTLHTKSYKVLKIVQNTGVVKSTQATKILNYVLASCFALFISSPSFSTSPSTPASQQSYPNVVPALPALVSEGEVMGSSQQWYRVHSKQDSYTSDFSADGRLLALTSHNSPVELWDTVKRIPISTFTGSGVSQLDTFVDISPNGNLIAINVGQRIEIRSIKNKLLLFSVPAIAGAVATFSPDGRWVVTAIDGKRLDLWSIQQKKRVHSFNNHKATVSALSFSHDGRYLVSADIKGLFAVWDTDTKELLYEFSKNKTAITDLQFSPLDYTFVAVHASGTIDLWDAETSISLHAFAVPKTMQGHQSAAAFSSDGKKVAISLNKRDGENYILSFSTVVGGKPLFTYTENDSVINNIEYRPDGKSLVVSFTSKTIKIFNIPSRQYTDAFGGQILKANNARISPNGDLIATGTIGGYIQLWDAKTKTLKYSIKGRNRSIDHISFSPDGQYIITGDNHGSVTIWNQFTNHRKMSINAHKSGSAIAAMSADNKFLATASTKSSVIRVWDVKSNKSMFRLMGHHGNITDLAFSPDGEFIASSSKDGTIKVWDTLSRSLDQSFHGNSQTVSFTSLAFSGDGQYLAGGTDQGNTGKHIIEVWNLQNNKHIHTLSMHSEAITALNFSSDGKQLISGSSDGDIKIWNVTNGMRTHSFVADKNENNSIKSVDFSKDGTDIIIVAQDGATQLWNLKQNRRTYRLLGGPRGAWVSENLIKKRFMRGDDGSLNVKSRNNNLPPAPLAPKGLASSDKLILTASRQRVKISKNGGKFSITIKNIGTKPSFWLRAKQLDSNQSSITLLSDKLSRLDAGRRGILNLQIVPHNLAMLSTQKRLNLKMEVVSKAGSHFPIVIPLEYIDNPKSRNN